MSGKRITAVLLLLLVTVLPILAGCAEEAVQKDELCGKWMVEYTVENGEKDDFLEGCTMVFKNNGRGYWDGNGRDKFDWYWDDDLLIIAYDDRNALLPYEVSVLNGETLELSFTVSVGYTMVLSKVGA